MNLQLPGFAYGIEVLHFSFWFKSSEEEIFYNLLTGKKFKL